jgi:hypothetical protein
VYCPVLTWQGDSHEISLNKGRLELSAMIDHFVIRPQQDCLEAAHRLYRLAVQAGFTKGRLVPQVSRTCPYWQAQGTFGSQCRAVQYCLDMLSNCSPCPGGDEGFRV